MSDPFVGEIRMVGFNFTPMSWLPCDGQILSINKYQVLFSVIGTTYGGDGVTTFALPDLRGRIPIDDGTGSSGTAHLLGESGGSEQAELATREMPGHSHSLQATTANATRPDPANNLLARTPIVDMYVQGPGDQRTADATTLTGANQPHDNLMPYLVINFVIAYEGIFPPRP